MSTAASYSTWITFTADHPYFGKKKCGLDIVPHPRTAALLQKAGILFKKESAVKWLLIREDNSHAMPAAGTWLHFLVKNETADFYYCTEQELSLTAGAFKRHCGRNGVWKLLSIPVTAELLKAPSDVAITMKSRKKIWEFVLIPRSKKEPGKLELKEAKEKLAFKELERAVFPGEEKEVYRFVTTEAIDLSEIYDYKVSLWEIKEHGENLLSTGLKLPKPSALSFYSAKDTITSYFYF